MPSLRLLVPLLFTSALVASEAPGLGHADFLPTPERPIGFCGDGNAWYPDAAAVAEFWDGRPTKSTLTFHDRRKGKVEKKVWDLKDAEPKNILWKTRMPAWSNSQPIVVGDKVFTQAEPYGLVCCDAATGAILWTVDANPWAAAGADEETAAWAHRMFELYRALPYYPFMLADHTLTEGLIVREWEELIPMLKQTIYPRFVAELTELDQGYDWAAAAETSLGGLDKQLAGLRDSKKGFKGPAREINALHDGIARRIQERTKEWFGDPRKRKVRTKSAWGYEVGSMTAPVSDGRHVFFETQYGSTACVDVDGGILWQKWFPNNNRCPCQSPLLVDGMLISMHGASGSLRGLDAATGELQWTSPTKSSQIEKAKGGYYVGSHKIVELSNGDLRQKVIVTTLCSIIRPSDGVEIGHLPWPYDYGPSGGPSVINVGDIVYRAANGDGGGSPWVAYRLTLENADAVTTEKVFERGPRGSPGYDQLVATDEFLVMSGGPHPNIMAPDGSALWNGGGKDRIGKLSDILAGSTYVYADSGSGSDISSWKNRRADGKALALLHTVDLSDPRKPQRLSSRNLLGGSDWPALPAIERWTPELHALDWYHSSSWGRPSHRLNADNAITAHGDSLYLRTMSDLYRIGPATAGAPGDDPQVIASIHAADTAALAEHLGSSSACYRFEATRRAATAGATAHQELLTTLAETDVYEEIRAAALIALNTLDGRPGDMLLRESLVAKASQDHHRMGRVENTDLRLTLRQLGDAADELLTAMLADEDIAVRRVAAGAIASRGGGIDAQRDALIALFDGAKEQMANRPPRDLITQCSRVADALSSWPMDEAVHACFDGLLNARGTNDQQRTIAGWLLKHADADATFTILKRIVTGCPDDRMREEYIRLLVPKASDDADLRTWLIGRGRGGDEKVVQHLMWSLPRELADAALAEILASEQGVHPAGKLMVWHGRDALTAAQRWQEVLSGMQGGELQGPARMAADAFPRSKIAEVRQIGIDLFVVFVDSPDNKVFEAGCNGLARFGVEAAPLLDKLKGIDAGDDKWRADRLRKAIAEIEKKIAEAEKKKD